MKFFDDKLKHKDVIHRGAQLLKKGNKLNIKIKIYSLFFIKSHAKIHNSDRIIT